MMGLREVVAVGHPNACWPPEILIKGATVQMRGWRVGGLLFAEPATALSGRKAAKGPVECSAYCTELACLKTKPQNPDVRSRSNFVVRQIVRYCPGGACQQ
jgi:hypothetical protein